MLSFVQTYSKFTSEFLLLMASAWFALMAVYFYHWVVKRRRLGTAGKQVPSELVRAYLNQMINEARFVRTQLFGILSNLNENSDATAFRGLFQQGDLSPSTGYAHSTSGNNEASGSALSPELTERLQSLEKQLSEKEGYIVNINIEKNKLLQDIESLKTAAKDRPASTSSQDNDDLHKKIQQLEQQLAEYTLFEDDLANIKRIKQENDGLKQKIQELSQQPVTSTITNSASPPPESASPESTIEILPSVGPSLDQAAIDALLGGESAVPPQQQPAAEPVIAEPVVPDEASVAELSVIEPLIAEPQTTPSEPVVSQIPKAVGAEDFDSLTSSVESSVASVTPLHSSPAPTESKSDEDLLKEFEDLLNS